MAASKVALAAPDAQPAATIQNNSTHATIQSLTPFEAEQERLRQLLENKPKAYQDKVMHSEALLGESDATASETEQPDGFRSYALESRMGFAESQATGLPKSQTNEAGVRGEYRFETQNYGEMVGQVEVSEQQNVRVTARNLGLPVTPETLADTSVGDISSEVTDAFGRSYRLSLGTSPVRGVGTRVYNDTVDVRAGSGKRGERVGGPYPGFETTQGDVAWLGYTHKLTDDVVAGVQVNQAKGLEPALDDAAETVRSVATSARYGRGLQVDGDKTARVTLVQSQTEGAGGQGNDAAGIFLEGGMRDGRYRHEAGIYDADPGLRFGDNRLTSNNRGAYWRTDRDDTRLNIGGGLDVEQYNPDHATTGARSQRVSADANLQYRLDGRNSVGGTLHVSHTDVDAATSLSAAQGSRSARGSAFYQTQSKDWGRSRISATLHRNETLVENGAAATGDELQWEQEWVTGKYETMRPELTTALGLAHDRSNGDKQTYPTASVTARQWLDADWNVAGNLRYSSRTGNLATSQGLAGTLSSEYEVGDGWRVGASASVNEAKVNIDSNYLGESQVSRSHDKTAYLYVGWQGSDGLPYATTGARQAGKSGTGAIKGVVFYDANRDGEQQADEHGVPGVEVLLDGRYRMTTDSRGDFSFSQVATGSHPLTLNLDSIPLPWGASLDEALSVDVPLRGQVSASIPVVQVGE